MGSVMVLQKVVKGGKGKKKEETPEEAEAGEEEHAQEDATKENIPPSRNPQVQATEHAQGRCVPKTLLSPALRSICFCSCCIAPSKACQYNERPGVMPSQSLSSAP